MKLDIFKMSIYENLKIVSSKSQIWHNPREHPWNMVELFDFFSFSQKIDCCRDCLCKHTKAYKACTMNMAYTVLSIYVNKILGFLHSNFIRNSLLCPFHARINKTTFKVLSNCSHSRCNYFMLSNMSLKSHLIKNPGN